MAHPTTRNDGTGAATDRRVVTVMTRDHVRLACLDHGDPHAEHTVVFLHGLCLNSTSWTPQIRQLTAHCGPAVRIISYDHRGHGNSAGAHPTSYSIDRLAEDLSDVLRTLKVRSPLTLVGHSMGGMTALAYLAQPAHQRPVEPTDLVLIATAAGKLAQRGLGRLLATPGAATLFALATRAPDTVLRRIARPVCTMLNHVGDHLAATTLASITLTALTSTTPSTALGFLPTLRSYDLYSTLPTITARTVVFSGALDPLTPASHSRDLAAAIPGAQHISIPAAGHMLPQQAPEAIHRAITRTLADHCYPANMISPAPLQHNNIAVSPALCTAAV